MVATVHLNFYTKRMIEFLMILSYLPSFALFSLALISIPNNSHEKFLSLRFLTKIFRAENF